MYLCGPVFNALENYLRGFEDASCQFGRRVTQEQPPFDRFSNFVAARIGLRQAGDPAPGGYKIKHGPEGDVVIKLPRPVDFERILESAGSEEAAFALFFKLLAECRSGAS